MRARVPTIKDGDIASLVGLHRFAMPDVVAARGLGRPQRNASSSGQVFAAPTRDMPMAVQPMYELTLDFSTCELLSPAAVSFLTCLISCRRNRGLETTVLINTMTPAVRNTMARNGFLRVVDQRDPIPPGNSVPIRIDHVPRGARAPHREIMTYLETSWLADKNEIRMTTALRREILGKVWELYANAFEHSGSPVGVVTCGQLFPHRREVGLTLTDFGCSIGPNVRRHLVATSWEAGQDAMSDAMAIEWAFQPGNTTRESAEGGLGFDLVSEFVRLNRGSLNLYSGFGRVRMDASHAAQYETTTFDFPGTMVDIRLRCEDGVYGLAHEPAPNPWR